MTRNNKRPGWKTTKPVNYHESPLSQELDDSDYEPNAKCEKPLDNKCYLSETRIAIQKIIDKKKHVNQGVSAIQNDAIGHAVIENTEENPALPDATDVSSLSPAKPVATSSPKAKNIVVPEATAKPEGEKQDLLLEETPKENSVVSSNITSLNVVSVNPQTADSVDRKPGTNNDPENTDLPDDTSSKPKRGEFRTRIVGIRRQKKDPKAFKYSSCSKLTTMLKELNAHFIQNHR